MSGESRLDLLDQVWRWTLRNMDFVSFSPIYFFNSFYAKYWTRVGVLISVIYIALIALFLSSVISLWEIKHRQTIWTETGIERDSPIPLNQKFGISLFQDDSVIPVNSSSLASFRVEQCNRFVNQTIQTDCTPIEWESCTIRRFPALCSSSGEIMNSLLNSNTFQFVRIQLKLLTEDPLDADGLKVLFISDTSSKIGHEFAWQWSMSSAFITHSEAYISFVHFKRTSVWARSFKTKTLDQISVDRVESTIADYTSEFDSQSDNAMPVTDYSFQLDIRQDSVAHDYVLSSSTIPDLVACIGGLIAITAFIVPIGSFLTKWYSWKTLDSDSLEHSLTINGDVRRFLLSHKNVDIQTMESDILYLFSFGSLNSSNLTTREIVESLRKMERGEKLKMGEAEMLLMEYQNFTRESRIESLQEIDTNGKTDEGLGMTQFVDLDSDRIPLVFERTLYISELFEKLEELKYRIDKSDVLEPAAIEELASKLQRLQESI